jgi:hypothetical protein
MEDIIFNEIVYPVIRITKTPDDVIIDGIEVNRCTNNSKLIIEKNNNIEISYVEGIVMLEDNDVIYAVKHAWNKIGHNHFDATLEALDYALDGNFNSNRIYYVSNEPNIVDLVLNPVDPRNVIEYTIDSVDFMNYMIETYPKPNE